MDRRTMLTTCGGGMMAAALLPGTLPGQEMRAFGGARFAEAVAAAERRGAGRLGVAVLDLATGARFAHRGAERFPMCSTFKFPLSAAVLDAVHSGRLKLDRMVPIARADIIANSPVSIRNIGRALSVEALCHATMTTSDNTAANLLLPLVGGFAGFNAFMRRLGDGTTRLDRTEPHLNEGTPGDPRDTTTPEAMLASMRAMLFGPALPPAARNRLIGWLVANTTGATRLRAGLPRGWRIGDKTGTGATSAYDVAVIWPAPNRRPILVTSYLTESRTDQAGMYAGHAAIGRAIAAAV